MSEEDLESNSDVNKEDELLGKRGMIDVEEVWYRYLDRDLTSIIDEIIVRDFISDVQDLLDHLTKKQIHKSEIPIEVIFKGSVLPLNTQLQDLKTTGADSLKIVYKYIKYSDNKINQSFFKQRDIEFQKEILLTFEFDSCILEIKDPNFTVTDIAYGSVRNTYQFAIRNSEEAVHATALQFLIASLQDEDPTRVLTRDKITIQSDKHEAIPDHTLYNPQAKKTLFICEGKKVDLDQVILENFDQLRSFSLTSKGKNCPYVYGLATNLKDWRFCCYIPPSNDKSVTADNFIVSKEIPTQYGDDDLPSRDFVQKMARIVRGFMTKDVDEIVNEKVKPFYLDKYC